MEALFISGFEPMVNQRLLPPTFPRYTEIRSKEATYAYFSSLLERLNYATQVTQLSSYLGALVIRTMSRSYQLQNSIGNSFLQEFFMDFGKSSPCVLSRSISQLLYAPLYPSPHNMATRLSGPLPAFQV